MTFGVPTQFSAFKAAIVPAVSTQPDHLADTSERDADSSTVVRRNLADALAHERNVLRTMIDLIPAFIYAKDARSRFTACNKLVANRMGFEPEDLIGKTDFDCYPREMAEVFFADEQALIQSGKPMFNNEEIAFDQLSRTNRVMLSSKVPLRDANGKLTGIVGTAIDITERKAAEARMASSERLESIGRLASGVAHEINTPIQFLSDSVTFIAEGMQTLLAHLDALRALPVPRLETDDEVDQLRGELPPALQRVSEGLGCIAEIVRSLKDFSHADQVEMSGVDLNRSVHSTLVVARREYASVADIDTDLAPLPEIRGHGGQINQVLLSLIVNAADAIGDVVARTGSRGRISARTRLDGDYAIVEIQDTGGGIPEAIRAHIFDPFFSTKDVGKGTGQGLAIARNVIVKGHGGALDFVTENGVGTTFIIRLPIKAPSQA
jgi:two-component system NtrC family sensor kinase